MWGDMSLGMSAIYIYIYIGYPWARVLDNLSFSFPYIYMYIDK